MELAAVEAALRERPADGGAHPTTRPAPEPTRAGEAQPRLAAAVVTLRQCLEWALQNNLRLAIERLKPDLREAQVLEARGAFDAQLTGSYIYDLDELPTATLLAGATALETETSKFQVGLAKRLITGAQAQVGVDFDHVGSNSIFATLNPQSNANLVLGITQPLLKGGGVEVTTAAIRVARNNRTGSIHLFRKAVEDTLQTVEEVYWSLYLAGEELKVRRRQLERAKDRLRQATLFVEAGRAAPVEKVSAEAEVARIQTEIIVAENNVRRYEDALKRLINRPELPVGSPTRLVPADKPGDLPVKLDPKKALAVALKHRPDLKVAELDEANAEINLKVTRHELLPRLDLGYQYRAHGLDRRVEGSLEDVTRFDFWGHQISLSLQIPLGNRIARSRYAQARLLRHQRRRTVLDLRQQIALEIKRLADDIQRDLALIRSARKAKDLALKEYRDERARYESQRSTRIDLLQAQTRLAERELDEIRAVVTYNVDLARWYRIQGIYLEHNRIEIGPETDD